MGAPQRSRVVTLTSWLKIIRMASASVFSAHIYIRMSVRTFDRMSVRMSILMSVFMPMNMSMHMGMHMCA